MARFRWAKTNLSQPEIVLVSEASSSSNCLGIRSAFAIHHCLRCITYDLLFLCNPQPFLPPSRNHHFLGRFLPLPGFPPSRLPFHHRVNGAPLQGAVISGAATRLRGRALGARDDRRRMPAANQRRERTGMLYRLNKSLSPPRAPSASAGPAARFAFQLRRLSSD